ncbi:7-carboxy-7-deazaguanine synthase [Candidatus Halobeggiatoa sp. HSG11]|nr:7-carboxy-7-deazaguanine synthase [Candidatus Halobeggiatoa sp. HSG11]
MAYFVKEIFYSLQGEGLQTGRAAVFCRFTGCNLWSGREEDRATAICKFCDTDFIGTNGQNGGKFHDAQSLAAKVAESWLPVGGKPQVICTGGEPLLQLDSSLVEAFHQVGFEIAIETNGTIKPPANIDWICVSPKANAPLILDSGDELKLIFPQIGVSPDLFKDLNFKYFFLQPMNDTQLNNNTQLALRYCLEHPQWRISLQTHKLLDIQ